MIGRRELLAVLGAAVLPRVLTTSSAAGLSSYMLADDVYPIGFFWPPPPGETNDFRYAEIAEAGFTFVTGGNSVHDMPLNGRAMELAAAHGLRALPVDNRISNLDKVAPCDQWRTTIESTLRGYQAYPAFAGFRIDDEPNADLYPRYRTTTDILNELAPQHLYHFNLFPIYSTGKEAAYRQYLARYIEQIAPTFVSFDHYALMDDGSLRATYFLNWALVRQAGLDAGLPTWTYILSVDHWSLRRPNREELLWEINTSLAYGCKGIQYFTYWTPDGDFGAALISKTGARMPLYSWARDINVSYLRPVGTELKHLLSESVVHANDNPLPLGATAFAPSPQLRSVSGGAAVLGQFRVPDGSDPRRWLLVANRSYSSSATLTLTVQPAIGQVHEFDSASGAYRPVPLSSATFTCSLPAGAARLYLLIPL